MRTEISGCAAGTSSRPDAAGRRSGDDCVRLDLAADQREGSDHRTRPDDRAVEQHRARADPHVVADEDPALRRTEPLQPYRPSAVGELVVGRGEDAVRRDQ